MTLRRREILLGLAVALAFVMAMTLLRGQSERVVRGPVSAVEVELRNLREDNEALQETLDLVVVELRASECADLVDQLDLLARLEAADINMGRSSEGG